MTTYTTASTFASNMITRVEITNLLVLFLWDRTRIESIKIAYTSQIKTKTFLESLLCKEKIVSITCYLNVLRNNIGTM